MVLKLQVVDHKSSCTNKEWYPVGVTLINNIILLLFWTERNLEILKLVCH